MPVLYFAWAGPADPWDVTMLRNDEEIFAVEIRQAEGDFPTLQIDLVNPRVGLLAATRSVWCWLSYAPDPLVLGYPIFRGRLIGIPENLQDEVVRLEFIARPLDYTAIKAALADTLKVGSAWDPVWLKAKLDDPDTALEAYPLLWHIDRVTLAVTASDIIDGEDGTVDVTAADHFYDGMTVTYGKAPLTRVDCKGTVTWDQKGTGSIDLTPALVTAFRATGSPLASPLISSLTGDGLKTSWPAAGTNIGGGWSMGFDSSCEIADWIKPASYKTLYVTKDPFPDNAPLVSPASGSSWTTPLSWEFPSGYASGWNSFAAPSKTYGVVFPAIALAVTFTLDWSATRKRSETVEFVLEADIQPIVTDPGDDQTLILTYTSDQISVEIDPLLGVPNSAMPIGDQRRTSYFQTTRGAQSFEYLLLVARTKLLSRARCVLVKFVTSFDFVIDWISCRRNVRLFDPRLPGGGVVGKITNYVLSYSTDRVQAEITIACTVGRGGTVVASPGQPSFIATNFFAPGAAQTTQAFVNQQISLVPGQLVYLSLDNYTIVDDGIDLFNLMPSQALLPTPAVNLSTTATIALNRTALINLGSTTGLLAGVIYQISALNIPVGATMTYNGGGAGTLSIPALATVASEPVTLTGVASNGILITNGPTDQIAVIDAASTGNSPDPVAALKLAPTRICLNLISLDGGSFDTTFPVDVSKLQIPMTVDLEAP